MSEVKTIGIDLAKQAFSVHGVDRDREGARYRLPSATLDRMLLMPTRDRLPYLAGSRP